MRNKEYHKQVVTYSLNDYKNYSRGVQRKLGRYYKKKKKKEKRWTKGKSVQKFWRNRWKLYEIWF